MSYSSSGKYIGSYNSLNPDNAANYGEVFTGYELAAGRIGSTTNPGTANQVNEVIARMNEGTKTVEITAEIGRGGVLEQTPQEQFHEIRRLTKLANVTPTMHAPKIDPAGFGQDAEEGGVSWSKKSREDAEKALLDSIKRVRDANPEGNFNVTIHASSMPSLEVQWNSKFKGKEREVPIKQYVVNVDDGRVMPIKRQEVYKPQEGMGMKIETPKDTINKYNKLIWENAMISLIDAHRVANNYSQTVDRERAGVQMYEKELAKGYKLDPEKMKEFEEEKRAVRGADVAVSQYYDQMQHKIEDMYSQLQKDLANREKEKLRVEDESTRKKMEEDIKKMKGVLGDISKEWQEKKPLLNQYAAGKRDYELFEAKKQLIDNTIPKLDEIRKISPQQVLVPLEQFAKDHAAETFSNIALKSYQQWGEKAPIIAIENWEPNMAFSRADQLKDLINESREMFIRKAEDSGISKEKAEKAAERMLGATWDIAHINLLRKSGFPEEVIVEETRKIAPYTKKFHLVDNFGYEDSHLPAGMGNAPIKKVMEILKENEFAGPIISEAFPFAQHFRISPHSYELEALGAPLNYPDAGGPSIAAARALAGNYFTGYGTIFPDQHFAMYGGGFSGLPLDLGGKIGGKSSQFSGTPTE